MLLLQPMDGSPLNQRQGLQSRMSRRIAENKMSDSSDSENDELLDMLQDECDADFKPVKSQPGLYYKVRKVVNVLLQFHHNN